MKLTIVALMMLATTGCIGTMADGRFCTMATDKDAQKDIQLIVESLGDGVDKKHVELSLRAARLGSTALCEAARINAVKG